MSRRKPIDKAQARERRNQLLETAAAAELSITEGVREMRAISGMTQEEFARHRDVSARVIKAIELGQGNPTVATLNRIGRFFGLEVAFVPIKRAQGARQETPPDDITTAQFAVALEKTKEELARHMAEAFAEMDRMARSIYEAGRAMDEMGKDGSAANTANGGKNSPRES